VESLERRLAPNAVLNRLTKSLVDPGVTNAERLRWLKDFENDPFGFVIALRPDFKVLREVLSTEDLDAAGAVMVKTETPASSSAVEWRIVYPLRQACVIATCCSFVSGRYCIQIAGVKPAGPISGGCGPIALLKGVTSISCPGPATMPMRKFAV